MASDYEEISRRNEKGCGNDPTTRKSQVSMYADTAHFIFELLQNADDKQATEIHFAVREDSLIVEHNGTVFSTADVCAISYFGQGNTDRTKIGHFGLGFKSVFAYTASPRIHSGQESFEIYNLLYVRAVFYPDDLPKGQTRFVLPFDHLTSEPEYLEEENRKLPEEARDEITAKLKRLGAETLLFTESLAKIQWEAGDDRGYYQRETVSVAQSVREFHISGNNAEHRYLVFDDKVESADEDDKAAPQPRRPVEIAFRLNGSLVDGGQIVPLEEKPVFVFFPTEKSTGVGFILQGPYRTTPARDNIPPDDKFNRDLVSASADLLVFALRWLRDNKLLTLDVLTTLPLGKPQEGFESLHTAVRDAILNEDLLPTSDGGYVSARNAKLARGAELVNLFTAEQLSILFAMPSLRWIDPALTEDQYAALHSFLAGKMAKYEWQQPLSPALVSGIQVDAEDIARRVDEAFMAAQSDGWVIRLYGYLSERGTSRFRQRPIVRLANGDHVQAWFDGVANAFLPIEGETPGLLRELPIVHAPLLGDPDAHKFLVEVLRLTEPDICDVVMTIILPCFHEPLSRVKWREHFHLIRIALRSPPSLKRGALKEALESSAFLLVERSTPPDEAFVVPGSAYFDNEETRTYFASGSGYLLAAGEYEADDLPLLQELGVQKEPRLTIKAPNYYGHVEIEAKHGNHSRGLDCFDPDWTIDGLESAVQSGSVDIARLLWRYLLPIAGRHPVQGEVEYSKRQSFEKSERKLVKAPAGLLIQEHAWIPDGEGSLRRPAGISLDDLPDDFEKDSERARNLARQLEMTLPHQELLLDELCEGDSEKRQVLELFLKADPSAVTKVYNLLAGEGGPHVASKGMFRDGVRSMSRKQRDGLSLPVDGSTSIRNPGRYEEKIEEEVAAAKRAAEADPPKIRMQIVRATASNAEARAFLYEQYQGRCQISDETFRKADGKNYFEAVSLVSRLGSEHLNHPGNMLCLSAESAAKVMFGAFEWIDDLVAKIGAFRTVVAGGSLPDRQVRVRIIANEHVVTWTEQHFVRFAALWKLA